MRILLVEPEAAAAEVIVRALKDDGHEVRLAASGKEAISLLRTAKVDLVVTSAALPDMTATILVMRVRSDCTPRPAIILTADFTSDAERERALAVGADEYVQSPVKNADLYIAIAHCMRQRKVQPAAMVAPVSAGAPRSSRAVPFAAVAIAVSTGGPRTLHSFVPTLDPDLGAAYFMVQHGPDWMIKQMCRKLDQESRVTVAVVTESTAIEAGTLYVAPGDYHIVVTTRMYVALDDGPSENYVKPSADPLFRSVAAVFGPSSVAVVMTGLGQDGTPGAAHIEAAGGKVLVQQPSSCMAPFMPRAVLGSGVACSSHLVSALPAAIASAVRRKS